MARLNHLGFKAEENKMYGIALQSEIARGKVAGYYIDRQIIKNKDDLDNMSLEELETKMSEFYDNHKHYLEDNKDG